MVNVTVLKNRLQCNLFGHTGTPQPAAGERGWIARSRGRGERERTPSEKDRTDGGGLRLPRESNGHYRPAGIYYIMILQPFMLMVTKRARTLFMHI